MNECMYVCMCVCVLVCACSLGPLKEFSRRNRGVKNIRINNNTYLLKNMLYLLMDKTIKLLYISHTAF